jgi:putative membrane protein
MTTTPRRPGSFPLDARSGAARTAQRDDTPPTMPIAPPPDDAQRPRQPRSLTPADVVVIPAEVDVFDTAEAGDVLVEAPPPRRRSWLARIFFSAAGLLVSLAVGLWTDALIRDLFSRSDWLGWLAAGLAALAGLALLAIVGREMLALARLGAVEKMRAAATKAAASDDARAARAVVKEVTVLLAANPATAAGRRAMAELDGEIVDGANLIRLAETELLGVLDARARTMILDAAKRVSVVTAVSPRAIVDLAYVIYEAGRLIRRLSELYGARPGTLGFLRLTRDVLAHLAVTGAIAAGDDVIHQVVGQGLAARLSARLGEGVVNGMMTARIGVAAMETVRPLPFLARRRPRLSDFLSELASFSKASPKAS